MISLFFETTSTPAINSECQKDSNSQETEESFWTGGTRLQIVAQKQNG